MPLSALSRTASSLEALRDAVDGLEQQGTILDPAGRVVHRNVARRDWLAEDPSRPGPVPDDDLLAGGAQDPTSRAIAVGVRAVLAGARESFETEYPCRDRWVALRATPMAVDGVGALVVRTDVTDRHPGDPADGPRAADRLVRRRVLLRRLDELLALGAVGVVSIRPRRTGPRSMERLAPGHEDVVRATAELVRRVLPTDAVAGRSGSDHVIVLLPGTDEDALTRVAVPLAAGWRARVGRPNDLEATIETVLALPGEAARDVLDRVSGELTLHAPDHAADAATATAGLSVPGPTPA